MKTLKILTFLAVGIAFAAIALSATFSDWNKLRTYEIGSSVHDFMLRSIDGGYVSLSDYENAKGFIVVFTSYRCPYSRNKNKLKMFAKKYDGRYPLIAIDPTISQTDIFNRLRERIDKKEFAFNYLVDGKQKIARQFGVKKIPQVFLLRKEKENYVIKYAGAMNNLSTDSSQDYVIKAMDVLMKGEELQVKTTKITGCTLGI